MKALKKLKETALNWLWIAVLFASCFYEIIKERVVPDKDAWHQRLPENLVNFPEQKLTNNDKVGRADSFEVGRKEYISNPAPETGAPERIRTPDLLIRRETDL